MSTFKEQGTEAFKKKDYATAIEMYSKAIEEAPTDHTILGNRAAAYHQSGEYEKAITDAEKCIEVKPDWSKGYQRKAMALQAQQKLDEAIEFYEKGVEIDPANAQCKQMLDKAKAEQSSAGAGPGLGGPGGNPFGPEGLMKAMQNPKVAEHFKNDPNFMSTVNMCMQNPQMFMTMMQHDPRLGDVFSAMTGLDMQMFGGGPGGGGTGVFNAGGGPPGGAGAGAFAEAEAEMAAERAAAEAAEKKRKEEEEAKKKAEEEASKPQGWAAAEAKKAEGNAYYKKKDFPKAIELYSAAIELCPQEIIYYSNLAAVYIEMKEYDKAVEECDKAMEKTKEGPYDFVKAGKVLCRKASALQKKGDLDASIETYKAALLENNDYWAKDSLKKVQKQKEEQEKLAYIDPALSDEHKDKGNAHFKGGDFPSALKEFDEALRRNPQNIAVYSNRAATYTKLMDPARALADAEQCIKLDEKFTKGWIRKAQSHQLQKEYHKAMEAW